MMMNTTNTPILKKKIHEEFNFARIINNNDAQNNGKKFTRK